ncbi:hypothetical protein B0J17DRAFT_634289 [Rhizoctonia solani]|nr:hypothetical protein B0J17DRAFT_634289 [Rhizoctonia solani]
MDNTCTLIKDNTASPKALQKTLADVLTLTESSKAWATLLEEDLQQLWVLVEEKTRKKPQNGRVGTRSHVLCVKLPKDKDAGEVARVVGPPEKLLGVETAPKDDMESSSNAQAGPESGYQPESKDSIWVACFLGVPCFPVCNSTKILDKGWMHFVHAQFQEILVNLGGPSQLILEELDGQDANIYLFQLHCHFGATTTAVTIQVQGSSIACNKKNSSPDWTFDTFENSKNCIQAWAEEKSLNI